MAADERTKRRKNSSKEVTRTELLAVARDMLIERGFDTALSLRLTDVTKQAGMTTGSAYQVWTNGQPEFHLDLAKYLIDQDSRKGADAVATAAAPAFTDDSPLHQVIEDGAAAYLTEQLDEPGFAILSHYWPAARTDPVLGALVKGGYDAFHDSFTGIYQALLDQYHLELVDGITIDDLTVAMSAIADGFTLRAGVDPDRVRRVMFSDDVGVQREWSLFAATLAALVRSFSRPRTSSTAD